LTGERTLPVLDAAHIKPYVLLQRHEAWNGILMRSDLHRLFDVGYITIDRLNRKILVSGRIREEFENGKKYYRLHGLRVREAAGLCGVEERGVACGGILVCSAG
jgi:predicted restriction endonuclease